MKNQTTLFLTVVLLSTAALAQYGIRPPITGGVNTGQFDIRPPISGGGSLTIGIGSFEAAQFEVNKIMEITGDDLLDIRTTLIKIAQKEPQTTKVFAERNQYYRSDELKQKGSEACFEEIIMLKFALQHLAEIGTGQEFLN